MSDEGHRVVLKPMTVADLAKGVGRPVNAVIVALLRHGIVAARNQVISTDAVEAMAEFYGVEAVRPVSPEQASLRGVVEDASGGLVDRLPIVVVVGHVDHGKTTLLDHIRKTRVAAKEKGGITQHLGAYKASTGHGDIVFLDTPGHEAFSMMRARGISVADIAVLIVAADDGVMPQTVEALERAKAVGLPVIVAINKMDKASEKQVEAVRSGLAQHDLLPEDWGGQTVCVPISALSGSGVDDLLEVLILQSQVMDLKASLEVPAAGYVLESHLEKGRGPVATIILQQGLLRIGDFFACGSTHGRVSSLKLSSGKMAKEVEPSIPVKVAGFSKLPRVGDLFKVGPERDIRRGKFVAEENSVAARAFQVADEAEGSLNLIIKVDTKSSEEALLGAIKKLSDSGIGDFRVLSSGIGAISESDVAFARDTHSLLVGLHVKIDSGAAALAQKSEVSVKLFDIIYKLLEHLADVAKREAPVKKVLKKTGEALVLKVFDIKKIGVVAGARILDGSCFRDGSMVVFRGNKKIASGKITSLQRERNAVKEVKKGFECAFMMDGFSDWQVDDRVECVREVVEEE